MTPLAIIPARAQSRRLPNKNTQTIGGVPLWAHAVFQARDAGIPGTHIAVSTDIPVIMDGMFDYYQWIKRDPGLLTDQTPMIDVVRDVVRRAVIGFDAVVLVQPTSPLRTAEDIRACLDLLERGADAVISVTQSALPELYTLGHAGRLRPQDLTGSADRPVVKPNGAVFAIIAKALDAGLDWWTANLVVGYEMPAERSVDIDTIYDLELASRLWEEQHGNREGGR